MASDSLIHLGMVKIRVTGNGTMALQVRALDDLNPQLLVPFTLAPTTNKVLQRLANYISQGIVLRGAAVNINDTCRVQDIMLFVKTIYEEYPE